MQNGGPVPLTAGEAVVNDFNRITIVPLPSVASDQAGITNKKALVKEICVRLCQMANAGIEGGIDANSFFTAINGIAAGNPETYQSTMQNFSRYGFNPLAVLGAIEIVLEQEQAEKFLPIRKMWKAASENIRTTSFLIPFFFFVLSNIIDAFKKQSDNSTVDISDWAATAVITACFLIGSLASVKNYFDAEKKQHPDISIEEQGKLKRFFYFLSHNRLSRRTLAFLDGASALHWLIMAIELNLEVASSPTERFLRFVSTGVGGLFTAVLRGGENPEKPWYAKPLDIGLRLIKAAALALSTYAAFAQPSQKSFWKNSIITQQIYFWFLAFPLFLISLQVLRLFHRCYLRRQERQAFGPHQQPREFSDKNREGSLEEGRPLLSEQSVGYIPGYDSQRNLNALAGIVALNENKDPSSDYSPRRKMKQRCCC